MAKFEFEPYDPTVEQEIVFDAAHYPDPASETETRKQLSCPLAQLKDFINSYLDADGKITPASIPLADQYTDGLMDHLHWYLLHHATYEAELGSLVQRDAHSKFRAGETEDTDPDDTVATKGYVDSQVISRNIDASEVEVDDTEFTHLQGRNVQEILGAADMLSLPYVGATHNGKILRVNSGGWAISDPELPVVTSADNGKILKVVNGKWTAVDPN